jgi:hypothetical protein
VISAGNDSIIWIDTTIALNAWANYRVAVFTATDSLFSDPCSTYSFHSVQNQQVVTFTKLVDFPISPGGLSALAGDSLILKEDSTPAGKFSAINIKDPAHPKFDGFVDSTALLAYPLKTLIPIFLKFGVVNRYWSRKACIYNNRLLVLQDSVLKRYTIQNNNLFVIDSLNSFTGNSINLLDTTLLGVLNIDPPGGLASRSYFYPVKMSPVRFSSLPACYLGANYCCLSMYRQTEPDIRGALNGRIFVSVNTTFLRTAANMVTETDELVYDVTLNRMIRLPNIRSYVKGLNTGCYVSAMEELTAAIGYTNNNSISMEFFVSDIRNLHSYEFALSQNAVYRDTANGLLQNILLDTAGRKIYLVFSTNLTILSYQHADAGVARSAIRKVSSRQIAIRPCALGTTIVLPDNCRNADLFIYDVSGRVVESMRNVSSDAVVFRPKNHSVGCYIASVMKDGKRYSARFMTR